MPNSPREALVLQLLPPYQRRDTDQLKNPRTNPRGFFPFTHLHVLHQTTCLEKAQHVPVRNMELFAPFKFATSLNTSYFHQVQDVTETKHLYNPISFLYQPLSFLLVLSDHGHTIFFLFFFFTYLPLISCKVNSRCVKTVLHFIAISQDERLKK